MPMFFNRHNNLGILPLKWLPLNKSILKSKGPSISLGMLPKNLLSLMSNVLRIDELKTALGNVPVSLLPCKSICLTSCTLKQEGNDLESKF